MKYLGDFQEDTIVYFNWDTFGKFGQSITRSTNGTISVYKDDGTTQSTAGITDTEDFDGLTGIHNCKIDLSADAFYATGHDYSVVLSGAVIDGETVNAVLAQFSIENRGVNLVKIAGNSVTDNSATLKLKQLDINNPEGDAFKAVGGSLYAGMILIGKYGISAIGTDVGLYAGADGVASKGMIVESLDADGDGLQLIGGTNGKDFDAKEIAAVATQTSVDSVASDLTAAKDILEADEVRDNTATPNQLLVKHKDTGTTLLVKNILTADGENVTSDTQIPGQLVEPS